MVGVLRPAGRAFAALVLASFTLLVAEVGPAAADPAVVVTPSTNLVSGQNVEVDLSGFPSTGVGAVVECSADVTSASFFLDRCRLAYITFGEPTHATISVQSVFTAGGSTINCHAAPGCVVGWANPSNPIAAYVPVEFGPDVAPTPPHRNLADGDTVPVTVGGTPAAGATVAQCDKSLLAAPSPASADDLCAPSTPVGPLPGGGFGADAVVHEPFTSVGGTSRTCGYEDCVIVLGPVGTGPLSSTAVSFGPTSLELQNDPVLAEGQAFVTVHGLATDTVTLTQCRLPLGANLAASQCRDTGSYGTSNPWGTLGTSRTAYSTVVDIDDCLTGSCGFAAADGAGNWLAPAVAVHLSYVRVGPTDDPFLDGQDIPITGANLPPGHSYRVQRCSSWSGACDASFVIDDAAAAGSLTASYPAAHQFTTTDGEHVVCRTAGLCVVRVTDVETDDVLAEQSYTMAEGSLAVSPSEGLTDGQTVQVTGTDLMPSYDGPVVWFPTGHWALTQCDQAVIDDPTLFGVFTHCAVLPPTRSVDIAGSTLDTTWAAEATIDKILGGTTDCTVDSGMCVIGLVRWEQDAQATTYFQPLTFGS